jgi:hypothetical protein
MRKWWWWWLPGWRKKWKLEKRRVEALSFIEGERLAVELMVQRPRGANDTLNNAILDATRTRLAEIKEKAEKAVRTDDLNDLMDDAEKQGQFRGYLCPREEIFAEGCLAIALMEEWSVPKAVVTSLRNLVDKPLKGEKENPEAARSALRTIFEESDSWRDYTSDYEDEMTRFTKWLFWLTAGLLLLAIFSFHFPLTLSLGLLLAGTAGSCVSVMAKMPVLEVSLSGELDSYKRRILSRIGIGIVASLIGCGLLGWGLISISIQGQTFGAVLEACSIPCTTSLPTSCTALRILILLAVPALFGFSERALTWFEQRVFGRLNKSRKG